MSKRGVYGWLLLAAHCAVAGGATAGKRDATPPDVATYQQWRRSAAATLAKRGDANTLAAAAALRYLGDADHGEALDWIARAAEAKPDDPALGWLRLELCAGTPGCDMRGPATTLRWIDADNGAAWLPSLSIAARDKDDVEINHMLAEMAAAKRFDLYWNRLVATLFDALRRERSALPEHYIGSDVARLSEAISVMSAESIPPFTALFSICRDASTGERREDCLRVAKVMQRGDTLLTQIAGMGLEKRAVAADGREARLLAERRRTLLWRRSAANQFEATTLPWLKNSQARALVARMRSTAREEDVCIALLRAHGIPLEPPEEHR